MEAALAAGEAVSGPEAELVEEIRVIAKEMNVHLVEIGQRRAKGSGTTVGIPDLAVNCAGKTVWIETKRAHRPGEGHGCLSIGQEAFIAKAADQGVHVFVVDDVQQFVQIVNSMRHSAKHLYG